MQPLNRVLIGLALLLLCPVQRQVHGSDKEKQALGSDGVTVKRRADGLPSQPMTQAAPEALTAGAADTTPLSVEQQSQFAVIFQQLDIDLQNLLAGAEAQIQALLTPEQQTQFAEQGLRGMQAGPPPATDESGTARGSEPPPTQGAAGAMGLPGPAQSNGRGQKPLAGPGRQSDLTDDQRTAIDGIMSTLHVATEALHDKAQADFQAILTPAQIALLDQHDGQENTPRTARSGGSALGRVETANDPLRLSEEQQANAGRIFAQLHADLELLHAAARQQILSLLTDQQKAQLEAADSNTNEPSGSVSTGGIQPVTDGLQNEGSEGPSTAEMQHAPAGHEPGQGGNENGSLLERLTARLNLTAAQSDSIAGILDNLQPVIQARVQQAVTDLRTVAPASSSGTAMSPAVGANRS
jgi:Spy/CpxP family protein refolding chaperone